MPYRIIFDPTTAAMAGVASVLALAAAGQSIYYQRAEPKDVLDYPTQRVENVVPGTERPGALLSDGKVSITGTKCNRSSKDVEVTGVVSWVSTDPPGSVIDVGRGNGVRHPGCTTKTFVNVIPPAVIKRTRQLTEDGQRTHVTWTVTGIDVPTQHELEPETWTSEPFDLYPEAPAK